MRRWNAIETFKLPCVLVILEESFGVFTCSHIDTDDVIEADLVEPRRLGLALLFLNERIDVGDYAYYSRDDNETNGQLPVHDVVCLTACATRLPLQ